MRCNTLRAVRLQDKLRSVGRACGHIEQASDPDSLIVTARTADDYGISFTVSRERAGV